MSTETQGPDAIGVLVTMRVCVDDLIDAVTLAKDFGGDLRAAYMFASDDGRECLWDAGKMEIISVVPCATPTGPRAPGE